ncbi:hypothetical protein [Acinetobacter calcoaceticus]|uniref:hypothetical protein n=1 Tax=Acinetobacter calcoaceticus TaxID=471 RepID=UPI003AF582D5
MRDFNSGDIHGDVQINDNSNNTKYKLLIHCTPEELIQEESHRKALLSDERSRKNRTNFRFFGLAIFLLFIASCWYWIQGAVDIASLVIGMAGVFVGMRTLQVADIPTDFEKRQLLTLQEISNLLRERGVRR